jgi:hypothetical protein
MPQGYPGRGSFPRAGAHSGQTGGQQGFIENPVGETAQRQVATEAHGAIEDCGQREIYAIKVDVPQQNRNWGPRFPQPSQSYRRVGARDAGAAPATASNYFPAAIAVTLRSGRRHRYDRPDTRHREELTALGQAEEHLFQPTQMTSSYGPGAGEGHR